MVLGFLPGLEKLIVVDKLRLYHLQNWKNDLKTYFFLAGQITSIRNLEEETIFLNDFLADENFKYEVVSISQFLNIDFLGRV